MIKIEETTYQSYGRCVKVSNGSIEVYATLDIGPRLIRFARVGGENIFCEDLADTSNKSAYAALFREKFGTDHYWHIYGGHRLWTSPEALPRSYYPDNTPVTYTEIDNGIRLCQPVQAWTQNQLEIDVVMAPDGDTLDLYHRVYNRGAWPQEFAPWCLSVLSAGGKEIIPMPDRSTGLLHNRKIALWEYARMNDPRVTWGDKYILLRQDPDVGLEDSFKFGIDSQHGWAAYCNHGDLLVKRFDVVEGGRYPDDGMCFETYTNGLMLEMESLGVLQTVQPGECAAHHESLQLIGGVACPPDDETEIQKLVDTYINK